MGKRKSTTPTPPIEDKRYKQAFKPIHSNNEPIQFKTVLSNIEDPVWLTSCYTIKPVTTENVLTIHCLDMFNVYEKKKEDSNMCIIHGVTEEPEENCELCTTFVKFKYTFIIHTRFAYYTFPPPVLYTKKNLNYFKTFITSAKDNLNITTEKLCVRAKEYEFNHHNAFIQRDFKGGQLKNQASGKTSFIRNAILGYQTKGIRATLTIDCSLTPHYITLPQKIYDGLNLATPLIIINRAPSIKNTCVYVVEACRNEYVDDYTIHINPYMTEGLHADQDGDELTIFYIEYTSEIPSLEMKMAISEMKKLSWKYGTRHDISFTPRYQFTQYHKYILHKYNDYFEKNNKLWASLSGTPLEKSFKIMDIGCSIMYDEMDEFINLLTNFIKTLPLELTPINQIINGTGDVRHVVDSGAKGSNNHITEYLKNLMNTNPNNKEALINGFNKSINSSAKMGIEGGRQFSLLYTVNPLSLHRNYVYYNTKVLLDNVKNSTSMASFYYNTCSIEYIINEMCKSISIDEKEFKSTLSEYL